jgi:hypothetical protein
MITELVTFPIPELTSRDQVIELYEKSVPRWRGEPDLVHKSFLYDQERKRGGGVYLWKNVDAARHAHDSKWCNRIIEIFGGEPKFEYFESPVVINNTSK